MQQPLSGGMKVAVLIVLITFVYLFCVTFIDMPASGEEHSKTIVGFLLGTVVGTLLNYYWGNSSKREHPVVINNEKEEKENVPDKNKNTE